MFFGRIRITFIDFDVEPNSHCNFDNVQIFDGPASSSDRIGGKLCGSRTPDTIESTGNSLHIKFQTDYRKVRTGFKVQVDEGKNMSKYQDGFT